MIPAFFRLRQVAVTASTNEDAKQAAIDGEAEGLVVQALRQTAGRGRQGRVWESPEGNLYMSVLLRPACGPQAAGHYSFVAALAVFDTVRAFLPQAEVLLKWPNDVLVNGKKISGLLLEAAPVENGRMDWLVLGIGVNVLHHPENALYPTTSLAAEQGRPRSSPLEGEARWGVGSVGDVVASSAPAGRDLPPNPPPQGGRALSAVLEELLCALDRWRRVLEAEGFAPVRAAWLARARTGALTIRLPQESFDGTFVGLDGNGCLIVRLANGAERTIAAGDVFFPPRD